MERLITNVGEAQLAKLGSSGKTALKWCMWWGAKLCGPHKIVVRGYISIINVIIHPGYSRTVLYFRDVSWIGLCPG